MRFRYPALAALLILELIAAVILVVRAAGSSDIAIDEDRLASARAAYQRRQARRTPPKPPPQPAPQPRTPERRSPEPEREPEPEPRRNRSEVSRPRPALSAGRPEPESSGEVKVDDIRQPYDRGQFLEALELAEKYLERDPDQAYVRRIAVTSACATGQTDTAREYYDQMNDRDKRTSDKRCERWGVEF